MADKPNKPVEHYIEVDIKSQDKTGIQIMNDMWAKGYRLIPLIRMERLLYFEKRK